MSTFSIKNGQHSIPQFFIAIVLWLLALPVSATNFEAAAQAQLVNAINQANNNAGDDTITLTDQISLFMDLPIITSNIRFIGGNQIVRVAQDNYRRVFFVRSGNVQFENFTIKEGNFVAGKGGDGWCGGGAAAGMGGAIFIDTGANVTATNMTFLNNQASGGNGGQCDSSLTGGGGGGSPLSYYGYGGDGSTYTNGGGAGGGGTDKGTNGNDNVGGNGGGSFGGNGGSFSGQDGGNALKDSGGGGGAPNNTQGGDGGNGGLGGDFGGGGGGGFGQQTGGNGGHGGFGGGGGGIGKTDVNPGIAGMGGYGGGGGGPDGTSEFAGGVGNNNSGGGGAGLGGAIFVRQGASLILTDCYFNSNQVIGGTGYNLDNQGKGLGGAIFIQAGATVSETNTTFANNYAPDGGHDIYLEAVAHTPSVTPATTLDLTQTIDGLVISRHIDDGPEVTHFKITNITNGILYQNDGTTAINEGDFITFAQGNAGLKFTPTVVNDGSFNIQASTRHLDTGLGGDVITATITTIALGVNRKPSFQASDPAPVNEDSGPQLVQNWVTHFDPGHLTESQQSIQEFVVSDINQANLFSAVPTVDRTGNLFYTPAPNAYGTTTFQVRVRDDGGTDQNGIDLSDAQTFRITINAQPDKPTITEANTSTGIQTPITISRHTSDGPQVTHFKITNIANGTLYQNDGTTVINDGEFIPIADNGTATPKFTPNSDNNGSFEVQASLTGDNSGLGTDVAIAIITVQAVPDVNQQPSFSAQNPPPINKNAGAQIIPNWANFNPGYGETHQTVNAYIINNVSNPSLFLVLPTVDNVGNLFYTPVPGVYGTSSFQVSVTDTGGTANGGIDTSPIQTFTIIVNQTINTPSVTNATTRDGVQTTNGLVISRHPTDGDEVSHFQMTNIQYGLLFKNDGITPIHNGDFITYAEGNAGLKFTPQTNGVVDKGSFAVQASTQNNESGLGGERITATIYLETINEPPVLDSISPQNIGLGETVTFTATATDPNVPAQNLTFSLLNAPAGASIHPTTGEFTWTPTAAGEMNFMMVVTDDGQNPDNLQDTEIITITVGMAPELAPIGDQTVKIDHLFTLTAIATYFKETPLTFSLIEAPSGAIIDAATGILQWTPSQVGTFNLTIQVSDVEENRSDSETITITVTSAQTNLDLALSSETIFKNGELKIDGQLNRFPAISAGLSELPIQLSIITPTAEEITLETKTNVHGEYAFTIPMDEQFQFDLEGSYVLQTRFAGNGALEASHSALQSVYVGGVAGYGLLVQGQLADKSGQDTYNKSLNRVYRKMKARGFVDNNIEYLNYNPQQPGIQIDGIPSKTTIQEALARLQQRMNVEPAPLFIFMVDHGGVDGRFYIDNGEGEKIMPYELDSWLNTLESGLTPAALAQPRTTIIGACYSGSFIPTLSKPGRVIVTSTAATEVSYKGPKEPDEVRSGEYFIEALISQLGQGKHLKNAFELATISTETLTRIDNFGYFDNFFQDRAAQHPLLEDNGDLQGSNVLKMGGDGEQAQHIYLGIGESFEPNAPDNLAEILTVTPTIHLGPGQMSAQLFTIVNNANRVAGNVVTVEIRPPSLSLTDDGLEQSEQLEIQGLERILLNANGTNQYEGRFDQFSEAGQYELLYFVTDTQTGDLSPLKRSTVYKNKQANKPPQSFELQTPDDDSETNTTLILDWENAIDPDDDAITYTVWLATEPDFNQVIYQQTELTTSMLNIYADSVIDDPLNEGQYGLRDGTEYFWKVEAIDTFGAKTDSAVFSFKTNNLNAPPSIASLHVSSAVNFTSLDNAVIDFFQLDPYGNPILDAFGHPIPVQQPPVIHEEQGFYNMLLPFGRRRIKIAAPGFETQEFDLDSTNGLENLNLDLEPVSGVPSQPGQIEFAVSTLNLEENQGVIDLLVNRVGGSDGDISVAYRTEAGSATLEADYISCTAEATCVLTWTDQETLSKRISLTLIDDQIVETEEYFTLTLHSPTGGATLGTNSITITIIDDDESVISDQLSVTDSNSETASETTISQIAEPESSTEVTTDTSSDVKESTDSDGDENTETTNQEIQNNENKTDTTTQNTNNDEEQSALSFIQSGKESTNSDSDVIQFFTPFYLVNEEIGKVTSFTVTRTGNNQGEISVQYTIANNGTAILNQDYVGGSGQLTWKKGDNTPKPIALMILDDQQPEELETIPLILFEPTGGASLGAYAQGALIISDNDSPLGDLESKASALEDLESKASALEDLESKASALEDLESKASALEDLESKALALEQASHQDKSQVQFLTNIYSVQEEQGTATLDVIRIGESSTEISVQYFITSDGTAQANEDFFSERGLLTWTAFDTEPKSISLDLINDEKAEGYETIHVMLVNVTGDAILGTPAEAVLAIFDNDSPTSSSDEDLVSSASPDESINEIEINLPSLGQGLAMSNRRLLPELGNGVAITTTTVKSASVEPCEELLCPTPSMFRGGVSKPDTDYDTKLTASPVQIVDIVAEIEIEPAHIGLPADILIVAGWIPSDSEKIAAFYMLDSQGQVHRWSENITTLVAYQNVNLSNFQPVDIYQGLLPLGQFLVFFGYRLDNGLIVFNGTQAIEIKVVEY